ncbi:MAG: MFS transporter [Chloroflexi bacterium]|nr:MAG: MFS transporter [Chloroflexota bacterium]
MTVGVARAQARVGRWQAFWIVAATFGLFLFAAAAPSPLYAVYAAKWHFSAISLTEVFAVYAIALLVALLITGSLSDSVGRRPVILAGLAIQLVGMLMFVLASSVEWLFAARITQGIATGVVTSALSAASVDLQPPEHRALVSAAIVQYGPDPLHLVYWLMLAGFGVAAAAIALIPEPATTRRALNLTPRVGVEPAVRPAFVAALPSLIAGWGVGGFYLSLGPSLALQLAVSSNRILGGIAIALLAGVGALSIIAVRAWPAGRAMRSGAIAQAVGLALTVAAVALKAPVLFFIGTAATGVGFGVAWLGVLRSLVGLASATGRGALLAAIFLVAYLSFSIPAVVAGYAVTRVGLHDAALWYGVAVEILALAGVAGTLLINRSAR